MEEKEFEVTFKYEVTFKISAPNKEKAIEEAEYLLTQDDNIFDIDSWNITVKQIG